jgi:hypothetical protein
MSGEPTGEKVDSYKAMLEKLGDSRYEYSGWAKRNEEYKKNIQEAKGKIQYNTIQETAWFDDSSGEISDMYENLSDTLPQAKNLVDFVEKVRRAFFLLQNYQSDILYGTEITMEDFQWLLIWVMEEEVNRYSEIAFREEVEE